MCIVKIKKLLIDKYISVKYFKPNLTERLVVYAPPEFMSL